MAASTDTWLRESILLALADWHHGAGILAAEEFAEHVAIPCHPLVHMFRDPDDSRDPQDQREGKDQRQAQGEKADAACPMMDFAAAGDDVHGRAQGFAIEVR